MFKNKWNIRDNLSVIIALLTICVLITPQVIAVAQFDTDNEINNNTSKYPKETFDDDDIWFIKPVHEKIYIADNTEISFPVYNPIIFGPITVQIGSTYQNELISIRYRFKDLDGTSLGPDVQIHWSEEYPNFDYYYAKRHFPLSEMPSRFLIEAVGLFIGIPFAYQNMTVFKIF